MGESNQSPNTKWLRMAAIGAAIAGLLAKLRPRRRGNASKKRAVPSDVRR